MTVVLVLSGGQVTFFKSNGVTLLLLLVKETITFNSLPIFLVTVSLQLLVTDILNVTKSLLVTTKSN
jgi:hypothetical protein